MKKQTFAAVLQAAGFTADDMRRLHAQFERQAPADHQRFLEFLEIPASEIRQIRGLYRL